MSDRKGFMTEDCKVIVETPSVAGTTTIDSTVLDMAGWDAVLFICRLGTAAANNDLRARQDIASGGAFADVAGSKVSHATNNVLLLDLKRQDKRFVRCRVTRGTSSTIDSLISIVYRGRYHPITQAATSTLKQIHGALDGVA